MTCKHGFEWCPGIGNHRGVRRPCIRCIDDLEAEVVKLRGAIRRAGFEVCQTSGDWTIHDVSDLAAADEERTTEVISRNIDLEMENTRLQTENADLLFTLRVQIGAAVARTNDERDSVSRAFEKARHKQ